MTSTESSATANSISRVTADTTTADDDADSTMLPVAAVYNNLDLYIQSFNYRFVGNILEDISQLPDGNFIVISSNIDSKYNCGYVTKFESLQNIPSVASLYLNPSFGPCNALATTNSSLVICGFDSGNLLALGEDALEIIENHRYFHNMITTVRLNNSESQLVASDFDGRITVVDMETFDPLKMFDYAHDGPVNDIQFHPKNDSLFLSCGGDNEILLWDLRASASTPPATAQLATSTQTTALHWQSENQIIFGTEAGNAVRYDMRAQKPLATQSLFAEHRIHKIRPLNSNRALAFLADDCNEMIIYDAELTTVRHRQKYEKNVHIRSVVEIKQKDSGKPALVAVGSGQSVLLHDDILERF